MNPVKFAECIFDTLFYKKSFVLLQNTRYLLDIYKKVNVTNRFTFVYTVIELLDQKILSGDRYLMRGKDISIAYNNMISLRDELHAFMNKNHSREISYLTSKNVAWKGTADQLDKLYQYLLKHYISNATSADTFKLIFQENVQRFSNPVIWTGSMKDFNVLFKLLNEYRLIEQDDYKTVCIMNNIFMDKYGICFSKEMLFASKSEYPLHKKLPKSACRIKSIIQTLML